MFIGVPSDGWAEGIGLLAVHTLLDSLTIFTYLILLNSEGMGGFNVSTLSSLCNKAFSPQTNKIFERSISLFNKIAKQPLHPPPRGGVWIQAAQLLR